MAVTKLALKTLAKRFAALDTEIKDLERRLVDLVAETAPALVARFGIATNTAAALLVCAGDNRDRLHSEASFAATRSTSAPSAASSDPSPERFTRCSATPSSRMPSDFHEWLGSYRSIGCRAGWSGCLNLRRC